MYIYNDICIFRADQDSELKEKLATIDDLHTRLKSNVDSVQHLNQQLQKLQRENTTMRADLERELGSRQTLQLQVLILAPGF